MRWRGFVPGMGSLAFVWVLCLPGATASRERIVDLSAFRVIERESGPLNYYSLVKDPSPHIHGAYPVGAKTTVLGFPMPDDERRAVGFLRWKWRALRLPQGGNECEDSKGDSAAGVYVTWKRGLRWYSIKYVWSSVGPKGATCHRRRNLFRAQDTVIVESGPPLNEWRSVAVSLDREFQNHFENADVRAKVPDLVGLGIMSDGDQTRSPSSADYADFVFGFR